MLGHKYYLTLEGILNTALIMIYSPETPIFSLSLLFQKNKVISHNTIRLTFFIKMYYAHFIKVIKF